MGIIKKSVDPEKKAIAEPKAAKLSVTPKVQTAEGWKRSMLKGKHERKKCETAE